MCQPQSNLLDFNSHRRLLPVSVLNPSTWHCLHQSQCLQNSAAVTVILNPASVPNSESSCGVMSHNYDNWERLVAAVMSRIQYLELAQRSDSSSSNSDDDMEGQNSEHEHAVVVITDEPTILRASSESTVCEGSTCGFSEANTSSNDAKERLASTKKLLIAIVLCIVLMNAKIIGAIKANSLAILTHAAYLLWDVAAFAISLFSLWAAGREATPRQTYGFYRVEVLGLLVSIQLVMILAGILLYEATGRLIHNEGQVQGALMFAVSAFGLLVNITMTILLGHDYSHGPDHSHSHLNPLLNGEVKSNRGHQKKLQNVIGNLIQSISVMIGGALVWYKPEWKIIDLICTLIFSVIVLGITVKMLRKILEALMESTPREIDATKLEKGLREMEEVVAVHDLHIWAITVGKVLLSCCVKIRPLADADVVLDKVIDYIRTEYNISHVTIQIERV